MPDPIVYVDRSEIREGALEEVRTAISELVEFVDANESWPLAYSIHLNPGGTEMTVLQIHPDSAGLERHMAVAGPQFRKFLGLIRLRSIDVYGRPSAELMRQLHEKAPGRLETRP